MRQRLAKIFIIGAIASLFFRTGFITPASIMPFEIFIWLALIFTLPGLKLKKIAYWLKLLALFIIFSLIGLWQGYISYNNFTPEIIRGLILDYYFLISSILSFLLLIYYQEDKKFLKNCFYAFLAPLGLGILLL